MLEKTDWDQYYDAPFPATALTRRYTTRQLVKTLKRNISSDRPSIAELGGANSCFFRALSKTIEFSQYHIVDNCPAGIRKTEALSLTDPRVTYEDNDVRTWRSEPLYDVVFSVGLVEHFDARTTADVIARHFAATKPGGTVVISVPTPTLLYRIVRLAAETTSLWRFPDERPMEFVELHSSASQFGRLTRRQVLWPIFLTQVMATYRAGER